MQCILTAIARQRKPKSTFIEDFNMLNKLLQSEYFVNYTECAADSKATKTTFDGSIGHVPSERHKRWAETGLVAGAALTDIALLVPRVVCGAGFETTTSMKLELCAPTKQSKGLIGLVNQAGLYGTEKLGQGAGWMGAALTLPIAKLAGVTCAAWLAGGVARGALLGAAVGRLTFGSSELLRAILTGTFVVIGYNISQFVALWFYAAADVVQAFTPRKAEPALAPSLAI